MQFIQSCDYSRIRYVATIWRLPCVSPFEVPAKKLAYHEHMIALQYLHYNFIRVHQTIKTTPAVAARIASREWKMRDFVELLEREERLLGGRLTNYKPAKKKLA